MNGARLSLQSPGSCKHRCDEADKEISRKIYEMNTEREYAAIDSGSVLFFRAFGVDQRLIRKLFNTSDRNLKSFIKAFQSLLIKF